MNQLLVTMGCFKSDAGSIALLDVGERELSVRRIVACEFPRARRVMSKGFTGACWHPDGWLAVCGFNAVYRVDIESGDITPWLVEDDFNDLHGLDIIRRGGCVVVAVANTGFDRVDIFSGTGEPLARYQLKPHPKRIRNRKDDVYFSGRGSDEQTPLYLRKIPDEVHPNCVRWVGDSLWVSRFMDRAIANVFAPEQRVELPHLLHDLTPFGDRCLSTTTDGRIWSVDLAAGSSAPVELLVDTFEASGRSGWSRGLAVSKEQVFMGLTRISRMPRARWADRELSHTETGVLSLCRETLRPRAWASLDSVSIHPKVFSILSVPQSCWVG